MDNLDAFAGFMKSYKDMVFATAVRLVGNDADAADIAQEVFLKAHERFEMLEKNPKAGGWLKTVATNLSLNHLTRYRARWRFFSEIRRGDRECDFTNLIAGDDARARLDEEEHRRYCLEQAMRNLPPAQRVPLVLYHFEELSYEEIAAKLRISLSKVKTDIHRGRESLRKWIRPDWNEDGRPAAAEVSERSADDELKRGLFPWPQWSEGIQAG